MKAIERLGNASLSSGNRIRSICQGLVDHEGKRHIYIVYFVCRIPAQRFFQGSKSAAFENDFQRPLVETMSQKQLQSIFEVVDRTFLGIPAGPNVQSWAGCKIVLDLFFDFDRKGNGKSDCCFHFVFHKYIRLKQPFCCCWLNFIRRGNIRKPYFPYLILSLASMSSLCFS
jgi:hypothetical protein